MVLKEPTGMKKTALLYMLELLKSESRFCVGMNQSDIIDKLADNYGITLNRETVGRNLDILLEAYPQNITYRLNNAHKRCCWRWDEKNNDDFDESEIRLLLGVIECYGKLDANHKQDLMMRIAKLGEGISVNSAFPRIDDYKKRDGVYRLFTTLELWERRLPRQQKSPFQKVYSPKMEMS